MLNSDSFTFGLKIETNTPTNPLGFKVSINDNTFFNELITKTKTTIEFIVPNNTENINYNVNLEMYGKNESHVMSDEHGMIEITDLYIDNILLIHKDGVASPFYETVKYNYKNTLEPYTTYLGHNGILSFDISTPLYIWLLENSYGAKPI